MHWTTRFVSGALLIYAALDPALAQAPKPDAGAAPDARTASVDAALRGLIAGTAGASPWTAIDEARTVERLCESGGGVRVAIATKKLDEREQAACKSAGRSVVFQKAIGWMIVIPVTQQGGSFGLTSGQLFKAIADRGEAQAKKPTKWSDIAPSLPDAPVKILLPARGSLEDRTLAAVLQRGCSATRGPVLAAVAASARAQACATPRNDAVVSRAQPNQAVSAWLKSSPAGAVAFVGYGQLAADPDLTGIVTLDGRLPSSAALLSGEYPAAMPVYALATRPAGSGDSRRDMAVPLADALLSESSIGPYGHTALRGLAPLPPQERVALRNTFAQFLAKSGVWE
jgi:ABC-type phosphate transport system substrate-binding protein